WYCGTGCGAPVPPPQPVPQYQAPPPPVPPQRSPRPVRPLPPPPYERGTGAQRKQGGDRWVRPSQGHDEHGPRRRPVQPPSAPRWGKTGERGPSDEPPTSR
ncbi:hypothetical protein LB823_21560, partial [Tsukamurella sp. M9C]|nr:hypothetical protein [Tsukamurella sp. M9C]